MQLDAVLNNAHQHVLASSKRSGSSRDSFSRATSAMGPNVTTGRRNPAAWKKRTPSHSESTCPPAVELPDVVRFLTLSQNNPLISWELGLDGLGGQVLSALPQVPLRTPKPAEAPEVRPVAPGCFRKCILHAGELLRSENKWRKVRGGS